MPNTIDNNVPTISNEVPASRELPEDHNVEEDKPLTEEEAAEQQSQEDINYWLRLAQTSYDESTEHLQSGIFDRFRKSYSLAKSKHPSGSKYHTLAYAHRSRLFRGKTQASIRKNEAAAAVALFSTRDAVHISAANEDDPQQVEIAETVHELANHHLQDGSKWFLTCIGAYNEAQTVSVVASKQYWDYEETEDGRVLSDKPTIDLIPMENLRLSPACDWTDPINSSPYVVIITPMYIGDILDRMDTGDWNRHSPGALKSSFDSLDNAKAVRQARENSNEDDRYDDISAEDEFKIVFVHENYIRVAGEEVVYFTAGTTLLLSDPAPLSEVYPHCYDNKRPIAFGRTAIEPHNIYSMSLPERVEGSQIAANEIANQRKDNVELVMNKRTFAMRKGGVDFRNLMRNVPGSVVLMNNLDAVKQEDIRDVTASAYQEQNMINADFDEQAGTFSNASVATNRAMNETVGGMNMLQGNSNVLTEYQLRIFVETWVEPVTRDIVKMVQFYEDDETIKEITGKDITNEELQAVKVEPRVSAGFGSTDPQSKIEKLMFGLQTLAKIDPQMIRDVESAEIVKEVFGALGYNDGKRFFPSLEKDGEEDPKIAELTQMVEQMQKIIEGKKVEEQEKNAAMLQGKQMDNQTKLQVENMRQQGSANSDMTKAQSSREELILTLQNDRQLSMTKMALDRKTTVDKIMADAGVTNADQQIKLLDVINKRKVVSEKARELDFKITTGKDGI